MKPAEKNNLLKRIINYCRKAKINGSFNNQYEGYLVSFEIEEKDKTGGGKNETKE